MDPQQFYQIEVGQKMTKALFEECIKKCMDKKTEEFHEEEEKCVTNCVTKFNKTKDFVESFLNKAAQEKMNN